MRDSDFSAVGPRNSDGITLIVFAGFIQRGIEEFSMVVADTRYRTINTGAIDVAVEHVHEHRDARQGLVT